jgi:hypothetical protein
MTDEAPLRSPVETMVDVNGEATALQGAVEGLRPIGRAVEDLRVSRAGRQRASEAPGFGCRSLSKGLFGDCGCRS